MANLSKDDLRIVIDALRDQRAAYDDRGKLPTVPMFTVADMWASCELLRHTPDGITPARFFHTACKCDILACFDAAIAALESNRV